MKQRAMCAETGAALLLSSLLGLSAAAMDLSATPDAALLRRLQPPAVDRTLFEPMPVEQRIMQAPRVKYLPRKDGYEFCSRITGIPMSLWSRPMACAYWNVRRGECTVVTAEVTTFNYIGHELRHCFEGAFHE